MSVPTKMRRIRVVALASYPIEGAASRYRVVQFITPLAEHGIDVTFSPFLDTSLFAALYTPGELLRRLPRIVLRTLLRLGAAVRAARADVVFVQREAMLFGPPLIEWIAVRLFRRPLILDLDDATWMPYVSPVYGRLATFFKWPAKTDRLIGWASVVTCGSPNVAQYAGTRGAAATVVPTVVDTKLFRPRNQLPHHRLTTIGWIGTHGTYPFLRRLFPVFESLARDLRFQLTVVGVGRGEVRIPGVDVDNRPWILEREVEDFQSLDIGVYPIADDAWSFGKSGFKAVQYMAAGVPFVMSPVGVCATMGIDGRTHFNAITDDEWYKALKRLLTDQALREEMGANGRAFAESRYDIEPQATVLASLIQKLVK